MACRVEYINSAPIIARPLNGTGILQHNRPSDPVLREEDEGRRQNVIKAAQGPNINLNSTD